MINKIQTIMSQPIKELVGEYITKSGIVKNRYRINPDAKPIKGVKHKVPFACSK